VPVAFRAKQFVQGNGIRWDWGDGGSETGGSNPKHTYSAPGLYSVKAFDYGGQTQTAIGCSVTVEADARALTVDPASPKAGQSAAFNAQNFPATGLRWDFGDGRVESGGVHATHAYAQPGSFTVKAWDASLDSNSAVSLGVTVTADDRRLSADPVPARAGQPVSLTAQNFAVSNLKWDYGDGKTETGGGHVSHVYSQPGPFTIRAWDAGLDPNSAVSLALTVSADDRRLTADPAAPRVNQPVGFNVQNFPAAKLRWDYGDGKMDVGGSSQTHVYQQAGYVTVKVWDNTLPPATAITMRLNVQPDDRRLTADPAAPRTFQTVRLTAQNFSTAGLKWDFGDGKSESGGSPATHGYTRTGTFTVKVWDAGQDAKSALSVSLTVAADDRRLRTESTTLRTGQPVAFSAENFDSATLRWDWGDGKAESAGISPSHTFSRPGDRKSVV
jgi:PKD repeat protein